MKNVCRERGCVKCCFDTEMLLLQEDLDRICGLGFNSDYFSLKSEGFFSLKNNEGRCVFHDGEKCTIYLSRPLGCRLYPVIFDIQLNCPVLDKLCPFRKEFSFSFKVRNELSSLYRRLINERKERL